jgi:hypothetical protein
MCYDIYDSQFVFNYSAELNDKELHAKECSLVP